MEHPHIVIEGTKYYAIACKKCQKSDEYSFYCNEDATYFAAKCKCGNTTEIHKAKLQRHPDR